MVLSSAGTTPHSAVPTPRADSMESPECSGDAPPQTKRPGLHGENNREANLNLCSSSQASTAPRRVIPCSQRAGAVSSWHTRNRGQGSTGF